MTTNSSFTTDTTSKSVVERLEVALDKEPSEQVKRVQEQVEDLRKRGLLNKQRYSVAKRSDFTRLYLSNDER